MKRGFTLIEVSLFIAVTGALFVGIIIGTQNSIWQQKYNDATQNFASFLRNIYAEVANTQGINGGRSDKAIYGKLISFGQRYDLNGDLMADDVQKIFIYDVIGDATGTGTGSAVEALKNLNASVVQKETGNDGTVIGIKLAGLADSYTPIWGAVIETTNSDPTLYQGNILVVRHPRSGTVNTLVNTAVLDINIGLKNAKLSGNYSGMDDLLVNALKSEVSSMKFRETQVDFCLNPYGMNVKSSFRRDIRLASNARNASGVEIVSDELNMCGK